MSNTFEIKNPEFTSFENSMTDKEIQNRKKKLHMLTTQLINANNIEEETSINNEIKIQFEFLSSLLKIKRKELNKISKEFNDPKKRQEMLYQHMIQQKKIMQEQKEQQQKREEEMKQQELMRKIPVKLNIRFENKYGYNREPIVIQCSSDELVSSIIERYRKKSEDFDLKKKFVCNGRQLYPELTLGESDITENATILVIGEILLG